MGFRDLIKKKEKEGDLYVGGTQAGTVVDASGAHASTSDTRSAAPPAPEFTFIRSDTYSAEVIHPPSHDPQDADYYEDDNDRLRAVRGGGGSSTSLARRSLDVFKGRSRSPSVSSARDDDSARDNSSRRRGEKEKDLSREGSSRRRGEKEKDLSREDSSRRRGEKENAHRLSRRLHLGRTQSTSSHVPDDLPDIDDRKSTGDASPDVSKEESAAIESQWEKRATILALNGNPGTPSSGGGGRSRSHSRNRPRTPDEALSNQVQDMRLGVHERDGAGSRNRSSSVVSSKELDTDIQEAIRLHEEGSLEESTRMFGILADPNGHNNPLSQVLYGLALRHGWGCTPDTATAVKYLSAAASNAAAVESLALQAGMKKGGAAKGELVLAIFELANCFRNGWGIDKDPIAAKQYYETAANLGDTDAMNEVAWCYLEGFGCKKDKFSAAKYYRLAEQNGNKTLGNSWIWKEKYDPDKQKKK